MSYADRVKETCTSAIGTGNIVLAGAPTGYRTFATGFALNATMPYCIQDSAGNWETGVGTLVSSTSLSRSVSFSSNGNALVNFGAGTKDVFCTVGSAQLAAMQVASDIVFSTTIPLTVAGTQFMPPQTVSGALAFTAAASPVKGAGVYVRLTADGLNTPTFGTMKEWGASLGYDNRNGVVNQVQFFNDGVDTFYSISQAMTVTLVYPRLSQLANMTEAGTGPYTYASNNGSFGAGPVPFGGIATTHLLAGTDGAIQFSISSGGGTGTGNNELMVGINTTGTLSAWANLSGQLFATIGNAYSAFIGGAGQTATNTVTSATGDYMRLRRVGTTVIAEVSKNSGSTWTTIFTFTGISTGVLYFQVLCGGASSISNLTLTGLG